ncbi:hypothetical protein [Streptomyces sp. AC512_CC834]|uniref:hypothetical protein n=1 Tax=Streptomyces sp. AC512_CC834 TaxID=2823691 RepID=UPI001C25D17A|nr:hypothetical protein [Streptomyces sp. AC512_CC834]
MASLQAKAGNRAVTLAIQRAATTRERPGTGAQEQASSSAAAVDDMAITPVREPEPEQQTGGKVQGAQGEDAKSPKELAVKAVADRKKDVADASLERSRAADVVWQQSGKALEAREKAAGARADQQRHTGVAEKAERDQRTAETEQERHTGTAEKADEDQKQAKAAGQERREAVEAARGKAVEAQKKEEKFTQQANAAEQEQTKAEADVVKFTQQAEEAEKQQKAAEEDVAKYTQEAKEAEEKKKEAQAAEKQKAAAGEKALQQAAKAEAGAEELTGADSEVAKWTKVATEALAKAEKADTAVREQEEAAGTAKKSGTTAGLDVKKWEKAKETAQQQATNARDEAVRLLKDATAAAKAYAQAQADVANHGRAAEQARTRATNAGATAEAHRTTATQARTAAREAGEEAEKQAGEATEAQEQAATAARQQTGAGTTEATAKTAHTEAKTVQADAEKAEADAAKAKAAAEAEAAEKAAEAKMTPAAKAKKAAKAEKAAKAKKTPEAAEQTEEPGTSDAGKKGKTTMEQIKRPFSSTKIRKWLDPADTVVLRGTAPVGAPLQAHGTQTSNTGLVRSTAQQAQTESGINTVNDALGVLNDGRDVWAGHKGSKETGPKSHQDRKKEKSKAVGLTTNGLMTANDGPKIANSAIKNAGDLGGMAALGDVSGALVMTFSGIFVVRDAYVALTTHKKKNELKEHFKGVAAVRQDDLRGVLNSLGEATENLARACSELSGSPAGPSEGTLQSIKDERGRIEGHRQELLAHMASLRDYAVGKQTGKEIKRALNAGGNVARTAAGAVVIASAAGAVAGPIGTAVAGGTTAAALGGIAAYKGGKKFGKRFESVRHPEKWARTTDAQEGTEPETTEAPKQSKDGKGGRKRDATKAGFNVLKPLEQGERQLKAQEIYALAAGPAVPVGKNVPDDVRQKMRDFLKTLNCGPEKHNPEKHDPEKHKQSAEEWENSREEEWANSLNDPERQKEWEDEIAAQLSSA